MSIPFLYAMAACTSAGVHACATNSRWEAWAKGPVSRQLLSLLTAVVEAGSAAPSWLLPGRGTEAAAAAAAETRLDSVEGAIKASVLLLTWFATLPAGEDWPALRQWLLVRGGLQSLINATAVLQSGLFKRSQDWIAICPAFIAVSIYSRQRISAADALWRDPCLGESLRRHLSMMLRECVQGRNAYTVSFLSLAVATEVMPNLAQQLHPDLLRLWPHLFPSLHKTDGWELVEAVVPSFLRLIEALPSAVKCAHWQRHCSIAVDIICLIFDALQKSQRPGEATGCSGRARGGAVAGGAPPPAGVLGIVGRAVAMMSASSELPTCMHVTLHWAATCHCTRSVEVCCHLPLCLAKN